MSDPKYRVCSGEARWAIIVRDDEGWSFMGKFCWETDNDAPGIRTFRTQRSARAALKESGRGRESKIVRVLNTVVAVKQDTVEGYQ